MQEQRLGTRRDRIDTIQVGQRKCDVLVRLKVVEIIVERGHRIIMVPMGSVRFIRSTTGGNSALRKVR